MRAKLFVHLQAQMVLPPYACTQYIQLAILLRHLMLLRLEESSVVGPLVGIVASHPTCGIIVIVAVGSGVLITRRSTVLFPLLGESVGVALDCLKQRWMSVITRKL